MIRSFVRSLDIGTIDSERPAVPSGRDGSHTSQRNTAVPGRRNNADVANRGFFRPPFIYLAAVLAGVALELLQPLRWLPARAAAWVGVPLVLLSTALFIASTRRLKVAGTPVPRNQPTTVIVQSGPFRFSRNPIYLALSVLLVGIACGRNSVWLLGTLAAAMGLIGLVVIPREERYLERRFGTEYLQYKTSVRRWF